MFGLCAHGHCVCLSYCLLRPIIIIVVVNVIVIVVVVVIILNASIIIFVINPICFMIANYHKFHLYFNHWHDSHTTI